LSFSGCEPAISRRREASSTLAQEGRVRAETSKSTQWQAINSSLSTLDYLVRQAVVIEEMFSDKSQYTIVSEITNFSAANSISQNLIDHAV
jgi:hypothetical protein